MSDRCINKILYEIPVFPDGRPYNLDSKKPKDDPGPARAIYSNPGNLFCNVIAHEGPGNEGPFEECDRLLI